MKTSNGDFYLPMFQPRYDRIDSTAWIMWRTELLISSIIDSLKRGSLDWNDEKAWSDLEMGYNEIKGGK